MVAMADDDCGTGMCVHEIASAAVSAALSEVCDMTDLDPTSPLAVQLVSDLYVQTVLVLDRLRSEDN